MPYLVKVSSKEHPRTLKTYWGIGERANGAGGKSLAGDVKQPFLTRRGAENRAKKLRKEVSSGRIDVKVITVADSY